MLTDSVSLLITDDDPDIRTTLCQVFEPRGFRALTAADGQEALQIVQAEPVHLLLLDMHMPRLNGLETVQRVQEMQLTLPCILMSAGLDDNLAERAREIVFSFLPKPIRLGDMLDTVQRALQSSYGDVGR